MEQLANISNCIDNELKKITTLHRELYDENDEVSDRQEIESIFLWGFTKKGRASHTYVKMTRKMVSDEYMFDASNMFNILISTDLWQTLPSIKVKDAFKEKIQIRWCDNIGLNLVERASLSNGTFVIQSMDYVWINMYYQFFMDKSKYDYIIGNRPELTQWTNKLPEAKIIVPQCWDYCRSTSRAIPIGLIKETISHIYRMRDRITSLLRIRVKVNDEWNETTLDKCSFKEFPLENLTSTSTLPNPELYANYANSNFNEWTWRSNMDSFSIYTYDIITIPGELRCEEGKKIHIPLEFNNLALGIFFAAEPVDNTNKNKHCEFHVNGANPITNISLMYGNSYKIPETDIMYSNKLIPLKMFSKNVDIGYNVVYLGFDPLTSSIDIGTNLNDVKAKLILQFNTEKYDELFANNDTEIIILNDDKTNKNMYNIYIRIMVYKKITISNNRLYVDTK
jgi:hypothetical protein